MSEMGIAVDYMEDCDIQILLKAVDNAFQFARLEGYQDCAAMNIHYLMTVWQRQLFGYQEWYFGHHRIAQAHNATNPINIDTPDNASNHPSMPELETQPNSPELGATSPPFNLVGYELDIDEENGFGGFEYPFADNA